MARVGLDREYFEQAFPHIDITTMSDFALSTQWEMAVQIVGDDDSNSFAAFDPEKGIFERRMLLYLALAHLIQLQLLARQNTGSGLAGLITSATEGSVTVSADPFKANSFTAQWWLQTPEGQQYWMLTAKYRLGGRFYTTRTNHPWG